MLRKTNPGYDAVYSCSNADYLGCQKESLKATGRAGWADFGEVRKGYTLIGRTESIQRVSSTNGPILEVLVKIWDFRLPFTYVRESP